MVFLFSLKNFAIMADAAEGDVVYKQRFELDELFHLPVTILSQSILHLKYSV